MIPPSALWRSIISFIPGYALVGVGLVCVTVGFAVPTAPSSLMPKSSRHISRKPGWKFFLKYSSSGQCMPGLFMARNASKAG